MSQDYVLNCVNCGKQNLIMDDDPWDVKCEFGLHPVRIKLSQVIKEEKMVLTEINASTTTGVPAHYDVLPPVPPRSDMSGKNHYEQNLALHKYYEANASAILADRTNLGDKETRRRWGFSKTGYKYFLKRRGLTFVSSRSYKRRDKKPLPQIVGKGGESNNEPAKTEPKRATAQEVIAAMEKLKAGNHQLPVFPAFDSSWSFIVQEKWLEVYGELARK